MKLAAEVFTLQEKLKIIYDLHFEVIFKDLSKKF